MTFLSTVISRAKTNKWTAQTFQRLSTENEFASFNASSYSGMPSTGMHACMRDLPWRHTRDPYHILVSEMMLHQTQVARVIEKYNEWLAIYPTFEAQAAAPLDEVRQLWRPLGYNFRPERLHKIAKFVVDELDGKLPNHLDELMAFRGIGRYTAGAILSFAFHQDAPIVDTNVRRLITRIFRIRGNRTRVAVKRRIWQLTEEMIPAGKAHVFNQALIDFGALVCTARDPACSSCFISEMCAWRHSGKQRL